MTLIFSISFQIHSQYSIQIITQVKQSVKTALVRSVMKLQAWPSGHMWDCLYYGQSHLSLIIFSSWNFQNFSNYTNQLLDNQCNGLGFTRNESELESFCLENTYETNRVGHLFDPLILFLMVQIIFNSENVIIP